MEPKLIQICFLALIFALSGCATKVIPAYQAKSVSAYTLSHTKDGLSIAVYPITDEKESDKYFGTNLSEAGILAVMVMAENAAGGSSKTLSPENFSLNRGHVSSSSTKASGKFGKSPAGQGLLIAYPFFGVIGLPLLLAGASMMANATVVKHNLEQRAFRSKTLSAGKQTEGFVYFKLPDEKLESGEVWVMRVDAIDMKSRDTIDFEFNIDLKEIKK